MGQITKIQWTDRTWNPIRGCSRISEGCTNCYAERHAGRFAGPYQPFEGYARRGKNGARWTGVVDLQPAHLGDPLRWRQPEKVFVNSMSDLFHEALPDEAIAAVFGVMAACPHLTFQVLTKRAERMRRWFERAIPHGFVETGPNTFEGSRGHILDWFGTWRLPEVDGLRATPGWLTPDLQRRLKEAPDANAWPLPNVWLGVSVEDQHRADERIPHLLETPAAVRFVSAEPLLGPVDLQRWMWPTHWRWAAGYRTPEDAIAAGAFAERRRQALVSAHARFLDWVIVGGESGPGARPFDLTWARLLVQTCAEAGTACFVKQLGAVPVSANLGDYIGYPTKMWQQGMAQRLAIRLQDRKGGEPDEWPPDLRVRQFPDLTRERQTVRSARG